MTIYQNNVPQANDIVSESQNDLQFNHISENSIFGLDHIRFNAKEDLGKHRHIRYLDQNDGAGSGQPSTGPEEIALYAFRNDDNIANPHRINLRARYQSDSADIGIAPFSGGRISWKSNTFGDPATLSVESVNLNPLLTNVLTDRIIRVTFDQDAPNADYFVWVQPGLTGSSNSVQYVVYAKTASEFFIRKSSTNTATVNVVHLLIYDIST